MQEQIWHVECLRCVVCNKKLSGSNWGGFVPPDNKPYCNVHHSKLVQDQGGATAFSGSTGTWTPKNTGGSSSSSSSEGKPRFGGGDEERCTGCGKRCYIAEKMKMEGQTWHPTCLRCIECNKMLSGSNWGAFVPPDNKPFCKIHYDRLISAAGSATELSGSTAHTSKWTLSSN
jgi:cysteine/glycine-rich protein